MDERTGLVLGMLEGGVLVDVHTEYGRCSVKDDRERSESDTSKFELAGGGEWQWVDGRN